MSDFYPTVKSPLFQVRLIPWFSPSTRWSRSWREWKNITRERLRNSLKLKKNAKRTKSYATFFTKRPRLVFAFCFIFYFISFYFILFIVFVVYIGDRRVSMCRGACFPSPALAPLLLSTIYFQRRRSRAWGGVKANMCIQFSLR